MAIKEPLEVRLWRFIPVGAPDECWEFQGARHAQGYGFIGKGGKGNGMYYAHRAVWMLTHGKIPDGMLVCHICDNPPCCNPDHLFLGTHRDNVVDSVTKGRWNPPRRVITLFERPCESCGVTYKPKKGKQRFCSPKCRPQNRVVAHAEDVLT